MRSAEGKLVRTMREGLYSQFPDPTPFQRELIERLCMLKLQLAAFDQRSLENGGVMTRDDSNVYLAWSNTFTRTMAQLFDVPVKSGAKARNVPAWLPSWAAVDSPADADTEAAPPNHSGDLKRATHPDALAERH